MKGNRMYLVAAMAAWLGCLPLHAMAPARAAAGAATYQEKCAICHGADGSGSDTGKSLGAPDLRSRAVQSRSDAELARFIREGNGAMPAFKDQLSQPQLLHAVQYLRRLGRGRHAAQ